MQLSPVALVLAVTVSALPTRPMRRGIPVPPGVTVGSRCVLNVSLNSHFFFNLNIFLPYSNVPCSPDQEGTEICSNNGPSRCVNGQSILTQICPDQSNVAESDGGGGTMCVLAITLILPIHLT